jgi:hypothetical protein
LGYSRVEVVGMGQIFTLEFCFETGDEVLEFVFFECCYHVCGLDRLLSFELGVFVGAGEKLISILMEIEKS